MSLPTSCCPLHLWSPITLGPPGNLSLPALSEGKLMSIFSMSTGTDLQIQVENQDKGVLGSGAPG